MRKTEIFDNTLPRPGAADPQIASACSPTIPLRVRSLGAAFEDFHKQILDIIDGSRRT
jgi:hypothetical protein